MSTLQCVLGMKQSAKQINSQRISKETSSTTLTASVNVGMLDDSHVCTIVHVYNIN